MRCYISLTSFTNEFEKIAMDWASARKAALEEAGPALGAIIGAGLAGGHGVSTLAGAAAGYGLGSTYEIIHGIRHRKKHASVKLGGFKTPFGISPGQAAASAVGRGNTGGGAMSVRTMPGGASAPVRHASSAAYGSAGQFHPAANVAPQAAPQAQQATAFGSHDGPLELATPQHQAPKVQRMAPQGQPPQRPIPAQPQMPLRRV